MGIPLPALQSKLSQWNYASYDTATYLVLVNRKNRYGVQLFRQMPLRVEKVQGCIVFIF